VEIVDFLWNESEKEERKALVSTRSSTKVSGCMRNGAEEQDFSHHGGTETRRKQKQKFIDKSKTKHQFPNREKGILSV
jgi:hypothetical protein